MRKKFEFRKIDFNGSGRKNCPVEVEVELRECNDNKLEFTASGTIWNPKHTDCYCAGQCLDTIADYISDPVFKEIYRLWNAYHLNSMHPGTKKQEEAVKQWVEAGNYYDYTLVCEYLESVGLLEDTYEDKPYKYGHGWIYEAIPEDDLEIIKNLLA